MSENRFCFIICTNSQLFFDENVRYIKRLVIPDGYEVDVMGITDAVSLTEGYNRGMRASNAKYKIYMHQDVFILYPYFLQSVLDIFESDKEIGMIGMVGAEKMSVDGVMWHTYRRGNLYESINEEFMDELSYDTYQYNFQDELWSVEAIDGLMMITSKDIPWREDIFDAWDFYDVSQSFEMIRAGYKVVVPEQKLPWCLHDDGILNLWNYDKYRKICMQEYPEFFEINDDEAERTQEELSGKRTQNLKVVIVMNTKLNEEHEQAADLFKKAFGEKDYAVKIIDLAEDILEHKKADVIREENPHLLVSFDMAGFEMRTTLNQASYGIMTFRMAHVLLKEYEEYEKWLDGIMNFSMFFYGMDKTVQQIHEKHPEIDHVQRIESCSVSEWMKEPKYITQLIDRIIADTEIELDY